MTAFTTSPHLFTSIPVVQTGSITQRYEQGGMGDLDSCRLEETALSRS
jgi:hypothetical protein